MPTNILSDLTGPITAIYSRGTAVLRAVPEEAYVGRLTHCPSAQARQSQSQWYRRDTREAFELPFRRLPLLRIPKPELLSTRVRGRLRLLRRRVWLFGPASFPRDERSGRSSDSSAHARGSCARSSRPQRPRSGDAVKRGQGYTQAQAFDADGTSPLVGVGQI
jgi:hypothetical protein